MSKATKKINLELAQQEIIELEDAGHRVFRFTDFHWTVNKSHVWPSVKKFQKNGLVRNYGSLKEVI